jgi:hypothetical protein
MKKVEGMILGLKDHCAYASIGDEESLLDTAKKRYHTLNGPASFILSALSGEHGISFDELKAKVMSKYDGNEATVTSEVKLLLDDLSKRGFLKVESKASWERPVMEIRGEILNIAAAAAAKGSKPARIDQLYALTAAPIGKSAKVPR